MKKLLSILTAAGLLFGFAACSGSLHDDEVVKLDISKGLYLVGTMNGWDNSKAVASEESKDVKGALEIPFTADAAKMTFAYIPTLGSWDGQIGGDKIVGGELPTGCTYESADNGFGGFNAVLDGFEAKGNYKMIIVPTDDGKLKVSVKSNVPPTPVYLQGLYLVGGCFEVTSGAGNTWSFGPTNLIYQSELDVGKGILTYSLDVTATTAEGEMGINDAAWGNKQNGSGVNIEIGKDPKVLEGTEGNFKVSGLTVGEPYRVYVLTYPDGNIAVKIDQICNYTLKFKATGFDEGTELYIDGNVFGASWHNTWPIESWSGNPGNAYDAAKAANPGCFATVDDSKVAEFAATTTFIGQPGETASYEVKIVSCTSNGADPVIATDNLKFDISVEKATFVVTLTATGATVAKE